MLIKISQDPLSTALQYAAFPIGLGIGLKALHSVWSNSPAIRAAAILGGPYALYRYLHYKNEDNLLSDVTEANKKMLNTLRSDNKYSLLSPEIINQQQNMLYQKNYNKYLSPASSALSDAIPLFAIGAALPTALGILSRSRMG